jgi:hypothetical protein
MKLAKIFAITLIIMGLSACDLNLSNSCENKWIITNNSKQEIEISFGDSETKETVGAATVNGSNVTAAVKTVYHNAETTAEIDEKYHVNYTASYSYSQSPASRALIITDQTKYLYEITNTRSEDLSLDFSLITLLYGTDVSDGVDTEEGVKKYTITVPKNSSKSFTIYKLQPTLIFYKSGTTENIPFSSTTDSSGKTYITIK